MNIFYVLKQDMKIFFRDIKSFILLFLAPLFITIMIGSVFIGATVRDIPIMVCTEEKNDFYYNVISMMNSSEMNASTMFDIQTAEGNCTKIIGDHLKNASIRAGIIIPSDNNPVKVKTIKIYYDNTKPVGLMLESYFKLISHDISKRIINRFIGDALTNVGDTMNNIDQLDYQIKNYTQTLEDANERLKEIDTNIRTVKTELDAVSNSNYAVGQSLNNFAALDARMSSVSSRLEAMQAMMQAINDTLAGSNDTAIAALSGSLATVQSNIDSLRGDLNDINSTVSATQQEMRALNESLKSSDMQALSSMLSDADSQLRYMSSNIEDAQMRLERTSSYLQTTKLYMRNLLESSPVEYTEPIQSELIGYFGNRQYIDFIFPSILILILMWMATFLSSISFIRQRNSGVLKRISISPTTVRFIVLEKFVFYVLMALLILPIVLGVAVFLFGIHISLLSIIAIFVVSLFAIAIFVSIGLIIATLSKTESTAILIALMLVIPLMFFTGMFYPSEMFPKNIKFITEASPSTISIELLEGFIFYQYSFEHVFNLMMYIIAYILVAMMIAISLMEMNIKK
jgi:ABC-2 type transport system permease protein